MPRNKFLNIKKFINFVNNENVKHYQGDKGFKFKSLVDALNNRFKQFEIFAKELSKNEQIVRYYGRHSLKQFRKRKPIRFGFRQ